MTPAQRQRILRQHLQTDALLGVTAVPVGQAPVVGAPSAIEEPSPAAGPIDGAAAPRATDVSLEQIDLQEVRSCRKCSLCEGRTHTVFGEGDPHAKLLFVGEGPGENEDLQGRPFVGRAGELLNKQIAAMRLSREQVYIANIVKCRPPNNRAPLGPEVAACFGYLRRQILLIAPRVIVTLGGPATKQLLQTDKGITAIRGVWGRYEFDGLSIPLMPTFHPAYLLRSYTEDNRRKVWNDLQEVMKLLA